MGCLINLHLLSFFGYTVLLDIHIVVVAVFGSPHLGQLSLTERPHHPTAAVITTRQLVVGVARSAAYLAR